MRKLTKKALSLVLCVMLVVSAISCVFSITADTGYTTVNGKTVYDAPVGLELDGDLSKWENITAASGKPVYVAENGVLMAADGMDEVNAWTEVGTRFRIPNAVAGTKVKLSFVYHVDLDKLATEELKTKAKGERLNSYIFRQYSGTGAQITNVENNLWYTDDGKTISSEFTMTASDDYLRIVIGSCKSCKAAWSVTDIKVEVTHPDGTVETYPATEEEEETITTSTTATKGWVVYSAPYDFDGAEGMSSWLGNTSTAGNQMIVAENGVLKAGAGILDYDKAWQEVGPARFKIPNAVEGTKVKISFDFAVNREGLSEDVLTKVDNNERLLWPIIKQYDFSAESSIDSSEKDVFPSQDGQTITSEEFTLTASDNFFRIIIRSARSAKDAWRISNITVTATYPDGTVKTFPVTEDEPETPVEPTAPADSEAPYYDVDGKGIKSTVVEYPHQLKPVDQLANLDFENGFRFWAGGKGKGTYASTAFNIVTDGDNSYAKIPSTGYVSNFQTALLKLDGVTAGDEIVVIYDVKGEDGNKIRIKVEQEFVKSIAVYDITTGLNTTKKADGVTLINCTPGVPTVIVGTGSESTEFAAQLTDGWTTLVTASNSTLVAPSTGSAYTGDPIADAYYIKLLVTCGDAGVVAGDVIDAAIDNIRIAKVVGGVYTDVATGEVIYEDLSYGKVAKVGDDYFATLEEAIAAANGGTVVLLKDIALAESVVIEAGTNIVLDLNGKTISRDTDAATSTAAIVNNGTLTIEDNVGGGKITAYAANPDTAEIPYYASNTITNCGVLTIKGGTIENSTGDDARAAFPIDNNSTVRDAILNIEGGTISGRGAIRQFANSTTNKNEVNITGGTVSGSSYGIWMQNPGSSDPLAALNVSGGTVAKILLSPSANFEPAITGGTISEVAIWDASGDANRDPSGFVSGGTFNTAVDEAFRADGYVLVDNGNGTYGVELDPAYGKVAMVGDTYYATLEEAIAAANGGIVVLIADIELAAPITIAKDTVVTLDLAGFKISYDSAVQGEAMISNKGTLTINDTVGGGEIYYDITDVTADSTYSKGNYTIDNAGTLTLNGGKINIAKLRQHAKYPINNNSTTGDAIFVMNGGSLYNYNTSAIRQFCNSTVYNNSVTINGGLVEGYSAIWVQNPGKNTVNGTLTITGGEIKTTAAAYVNGSATVGEVSSKIYFTTEGGAWSETSALVITGGTFNENIYLAEEAPESITTEETATYNGYVELPFVEEYDLETRLYYVKGFKPTGSEETRYGFLMTIGIDSLDYKRNGCGFYVTIGDETQRFVIENGVVWDSLTVELDSGTVELTPVQFGESNQYIMHYTVYFTEEQLEALGSMEVSVKGFVTTFEGEELTTKTFNCGTLA